MFISKKRLTAIERELTSLRMSTTMCRTRRVYPGEAVPCASDPARTFNKKGAQKYSSLRPPLTLAPIPVTRAVELLLAAQGWELCFRPGPDGRPAATLEKLTFVETSKGKKSCHK